MSENGKLRLKLLDENGNYLGEQVEIDLSHRTLNERRIFADNAAQEIVITDLRTAPDGHYRLEIHPRSFKPKGQIVEIAADGITDIELTFQRRDDLENVKG